MTVKILKVIIKVLKFYKAKRHMDQSQKTSTFMHWLDLNDLTLLHPLGKKVKKKKTFACSHGSNKNTNYVHSKPAKVLKNDK